MESNTDSGETPAPIRKAQPIRVVLCAIAVTMAILAAYSNHFQNGFHFDDSHVIVNNGFIRSVRYIPRFFTDATTFSALPSNQSYRPVVSLTLAIDYALGGGLEPFWFQASNFLWFLILTALLALLVKHLLDWRGTDPRHGIVAVLTAGVYGLHPANADTVNYICARSDILSTLGIAAAFALYLFLPRSRAWGLHLLPVAVGMLAKPITAVFAPLFALYLLLFPEAGASARGRGRRVLRYAAATVPAFLLCGAMSLLVWKMTPKTWVAGAADARQYLITQPYVALLYFKTFLWPSGLSVDYDLQPLASAGDPRLWAGALFTLALVAGGIVAAIFRGTRVIGFGLLWFLFALLPTSLSPLAEAMNDHRTFFPYMGLAIALAGAAALALERVRARGPAWNRIAAGAAALLLSASAFATYHRNEVWGTDVALWRDAAVKGPRNGRALMNYGNALMEMGRLKDALDEFQRARKESPFYPIVYINLAIVESALGNQAQAAQDFAMGLQLGPQIPDCHTYYADWLIKQGRRAEAEAQVRTALQLSPEDLKAQTLLSQLTAAPALSPADRYLELSLVQYRAGRYVDSIASARQALKLNPNYAEAYNNIGAAWNALGRYDLGAAACVEAIKLKPGFTLAVNNLNFAIQMAGKAQKAPSPAGTVGAS